jgi:small subunit ribosomal protein S20
MPIIRSAKKKMRQDKKRTAHNKLKKDNIKALVKNMRREPNVEGFAKVSSALDKAVKTDFIHPNKASRLKSRLSKLITAAK